MVDIKFCHILPPQKKIPFKFDDYFLIKNNLVRKYSSVLCVTFWRPFTQLIFFLLTSTLHNSSKICTLQLLSPSSLLITHYTSLPLSLPHYFNFSKVFEAIPSTWEKHYKILAMYKKQAKSHPTPYNKWLCQKKV
jgi:hypothetical protein